MKKTTFILLFLLASLSVAQNSTDTVFHHWGMGIDFYGFFNNNIGLNYRIDPTTTVILRGNASLNRDSYTSQNTPYSFNLNIGLSKQIYRIGDVSINALGELGAEKSFGVASASWSVGGPTEYNYYHTSSGLIRGGIIGEYWITQQMTLSMTHSILYTYTFNRFSKLGGSDEHINTVEIDYRYITLTYYF